MDNKEKILQTMRDKGEPMSAGQIAEASGVDRKEVDKIMTQLKKEETIVSPKRCYWQPAQ